MPAGCRLHSPVDHRSGTVEEILARLATASHGVVTHRGMLSAGLSATEIATRARRGQLIRVHNGVYRVGHRAPTIEARYLAAVLACGDRAVLTGLAAAHLQGLVKGVTPKPCVSAPTKRHVEGVRTRRSKLVTRDIAIIFRGVPVTPPAWTLVDVSPELAEEELARACHEAGVRYRTSPADVDTVLALRRGAAGSGTLRKILRGEVHVTLSRLERAFLRLLHDAGLPLPITNRPAGGRRVDCRWPEHRLTVELDSYRYHSSRHAWEQDRRREREAYARGDDLRRYTYDDVFSHPRLMLAELRRLLDPARLPD
jgi:predicted transcriptional regulator of viral defense system